MEARLQQSHFIEKSGLTRAPLSSVFLNRQDLKATGGSRAGQRTQLWALVGRGDWSVLGSSEETAKMFPFNNREEQYSLFFWKFRPLKVRFPGKPHF